MSQLVAACPGGLPWPNPDEGWRWQRLQNFCSSHGKLNKRTLSAQLAFITYDIKVCMPALHSAAIDTHNDKLTDAEVRDAFQPYFNALKENAP